MSNRLRPWVPKVVVLALAVASLRLARLPVLSDDERRELAGQFRFERMRLIADPVNGRTSRDVHPKLRHISAWISSVGSSVALGDIDGDGLPNDACIVDPRTDLASVVAVPGTGDRYPGFTLAPDTSPDHVAPMGCRLGDFNDDALMDVLVYYWGRTPVMFLRRASSDAGATLPPERSFYAAVDVAPGGGRWNTNALTTADVDGDGRLDLVVGNYFPDGMALLDPEATSPAVMQDSMARAYNGGVNRVLLNAGGAAGPEPTVVFRDVPGIFSPEVASGWTLAVGAADLDGDLLPELYFANDFGPDRLLYNQSRPGSVRFSGVTGRKTFFTPSSSVLGRDSFKGMGVDFGDLNGDGIIDLFVSNIANEFALQESHFAFIGTGDMTAAFLAGRAPFEERSEPLGLSRSGFSWEARLADYNNDGVPEVQQAAGFVRGPVNRWPELQELAMGNNLTIEDPDHWPRFDEGADISGGLHNPFYVRSSSGRFYDLAADVGIGHAQVARGIAVADVDGDGDLDFAVARQWEPFDFYRNDTPGGGRSLLLQLLVPASRAQSDGAAPPGRPAIGATVTAILPDGRRLIAQVEGGNGHTGARAPECHLGLGALPDATMIPVEIRWRDTTGAVRQLTRNFSVDQRGPRTRQRLVLLDSGGATEW